MTPEQDRAPPRPISTDDAFIAFHEMTPDGFMMFHPVRAEDGEIVDLQWTFVNRAAGRIVGRDPGELIGKQLLVEMPGNRDEGLFDAYVSVIETGETWQDEFHYDHGGIDAWFRTTAAKSGDDLAVSFADITASRQGEDRLRHLIDGVLAFVGVLTLDGVLIEANEPAVTAAGVDRDELIGVPFWDCYWWGVDEATKDRLKEAVKIAGTGQRIRYDAEIRIAGDQRMWIDFQIAPVFDKTGQVIELIPSGVDITERKHSERQREFLINELGHRVKNTLATIQSIAGQSIRGAGSMAEFGPSFGARLRAISASHDLVVQFDHEDVSLLALVLGQVQPYAANPDNLQTEGEDVLLPGEVAQSLGLVLHELSTNASKYGALSTETGVVTISWRVTTKGDARLLRIKWQERGGPKVEAPTRVGFGTRLIRRSLAPDAEGEAFDFSPEGLTCTLETEL